MCDKKMAAGEKISCTTAKGTNLLQDRCITDTIDLTCPANNNFTTTLPHFSKANTVKCKACQANQVATDLDSREGYFWTTLKFGPNQHQHGNVNHVSEMYITHYEARMVDAGGNIYGPSVGTVPVKPMTKRASCCAVDSYHMSVKGSWVAGATHFVIVPHNATAGFSLPYGATVPFTDVKTGAASMKIVKSKVTLAMADVDAFLASPHANEIMQKSLFESLKASTAGLQLEWVVIEGLTKVARRLLVDAKIRRLAAGSVDVRYKIIFPTSFTGTLPDASSIDKTTMSAQVKAVAQAVAGLTVEVTSVTAAPIETENLNPSTSSEPTQTGAATRFSLTLTSLAVVLMMLFRQ